VELEARGWVEDKLAISLMPFLDAGTSPLVWVCVAYEVAIESIRMMLARAADTGHSD